MATWSWSSAGRGEFSGERYLSLEICKRLKNRSWIQYCNRELLLLNSLPQATKQPVAESAAPVVPQTNPFEFLIERIRERDTGPGVEIEELVGVVPEGDKFIRTLLEEGEVLEVRPERLKVPE